MRVRIGILVGLLLAVSIFVGDELFVGSVFVRPVEAQTQKRVHVLEVITVEDGKLAIVCDPQRQNMIYIVSNASFGRGSGGPTPAISVVHQPDICK